MGEVINMFTYIQEKEDAEMERQYQEFISLLKYFVFIQEPKCERVYLIFDDNGDCTIKDKDFNEVDVSEEDMKMKEEIGAELDFDDFIVSTLISLAPKTIQCFNSKTIPEKLKITLVSVFDDKVSFSNKKNQKRRLNNESK